MSRTSVIRLFSKGDVLTVVNRYSVSLIIFITIIIFATIIAYSETLTPYEKGALAGRLGFGAMTLDAYDEICVSKGIRKDEHLKGIDKALEKKWGFTYSDWEAKQKLNSRQEAHTLVNDVIRKTGGCNTIGMKQWVREFRDIYKGDIKKFQAVFSLDEDSKRLAFCTSVFPYAANYFMLQNNESAAKVMLFQQARTTITLFSIHYKDGQIPKERVEAIDIEAKKAKPFLDSNPTKFPETVDECIAISNAFATKRSNKKIKMWGKDFDTLVEESAAKGRAQLGIR
jgi:hypothetical protein